MIGLAAAATAAPPSTPSTPQLHTPLTPSTPSSPIDTQGHGYVSPVSARSLLKNGELLQAAKQSGFQVVVTADRNLSHQQKLKEQTLATVVLPSGQCPVDRIRANHGEIRKCSPHLGASEKMAVERK